jgi:hypothetical protein
MSESANTTAHRSSSLRRNLVLLASYLVIMTLIAGAYS